jgi:hypothetical protein
MKIFGFFIMTLVIASIFSTNVLAFHKCIEVLDQEQPIHDANTFVIGEALKAQSFVPTKNKLTRIELFICRSGTINSDFVVSIRDNLYGNDLTMISKQANQIPTGTINQDWIEFDFNDLDITPGNTYYIVCSTQGGNLDNCYVLGMSTNNPYTLGDAWDYGAFTGYVWEKMVDDDLSFRTYCQKAKSRDIDIIYIINRMVENFPILQPFSSYFL